MRKLRKWEEEYMLYKNGTKEKRIKEIEEKLSNKTATKAEYDELKQIKKVSANIEKVSNIIEYKYEIEKQINEIKEEIKLREETANRTKQLDEITKEGEEINKELAILDLKKDMLLKGSKGLSPEEKEKNNKEIEEINEKIAENNSKYIKNQEKLTNLPEEKNTRRNNKFSGIETEELNKRIFDLSTKVSKCNMIAGNLMKGMSWDNIELKLDQWKDKKYTSKEKIREKAEIDLGVKSLVNGTDKKIQEYKGNGEITEIPEFFKKHPKIYEFVRNHPRIQKAYNYLSEKFGNRKEEIEETKETEELEKPEEKVEPIKVEDDFKKRIKEIAEKGIKEVRKEKLEKAKESAIRSEKEKFSKEKESNDHEIGDE